MIPYFSYTSIPVGPLTIHVWGLAVASGMLAAILLARRIAERAGLDGEVIFDLALWVLMPAFIFSRLGHVVFYNPTMITAHPLDVLKIWQGGMSSFGGYIGAALGIYAYVKVRKIKLRPYAEIAAYVLPLGYGIGRIGCFLIHDHPGIPCSCLLAVAFPGGPRLDHGLLLSMFGFSLFAVFVLLRRRVWTVGADRWRYLPILLISYGSYRFILDFFRAWDLPHSDTRYLMLTPSQYGGVLFVAIGLFILFNQRNLKRLTGYT